MKTMRLSEAIRLGAMLRPQITGALREQCADKTYGTCALGAAFEAAMCEKISQIATQDSTTFRGVEIKKGERINVVQIPDSWIAFEKVVNCPVCGEPARLKCVVSAHLNDLHLWTREEIAAWVETQEPKKRTKPSPVATGRKSKSQRVTEE